MNGYETVDEGRRPIRLASFLVRTALAATLGLTPTLTVAQPTAGDEFQVNTFTTDDQRSADVAAVPGGGFMIAWTSSSSATDPLLSVQAQRYGTDGQPDGGEFMINSYTPGWQRSPAVAFHDDGSYVVAFSAFGSPGGDTNEDSIQLRRFSNLGVPLGDDVQVNTYTTGAQLSPDVSVLADGGFVIVWSSYGSLGNDDDWDSVQARLYSPAGAPLGNEFQVNTYTTERQRPARVQTLEDGGFVVTWTSWGSNGSDDSGYSVQARRYDASGDPLTGQFQVNTYTDSFQRSSDVVTTTDSEFVVVWGSSGSTGTDTQGYSVQARRYAADGTPLGGEFQLNSFTDGSQLAPSVARVPSGGFVVSWSSSESDGTDDDQRSVRARLFDEQWSPQGDDWQVNQYTTSWQQRSRVAVDRGHFVVSWQSDGSAGSDADGYSVQARRYTFSSIFSDGFESGDTSAWSQTVP